MLNGILPPLLFAAFADEIPFILHYAPETLDYCDPLNFANESAFSSSHMGYPLFAAGVRFLFGILKIFAFGCLSLLESYFVMPARLCAEIPRWKLLCTGVCSWFDCRIVSSFWIPSVVNVLRYSSSRIIFVDLATANVFDVILLLLLLLLLEF